MAVGFGALYVVWRGSDWRHDRNRSIAKTDELVEALKRFNRRFGDSSTRLGVPQAIDLWPSQRARLLQGSTFRAWLSAGMPRETLRHPESEMLFNFSRTWAAPLAWSISNATTISAGELETRIAAVIDPQTNQFRIGRPPSSPAATA